MSFISRLLPLVCLSALVFTACHQPSPATSVATAPLRYPTIVRLESRNYSITISAGPKCAVYSICDANGQMLVDNISLNDLRTRHPELFDLLIPALAPNAAASAQTTSAISFADDN